MTISNFRTDGFVKTVTKLFTEEEERNLFEEYNRLEKEGKHKRAEKVLETIIVNYTPIVKSQARKLNGYGIPEDDLISEGLVALVESAKRFDLSQNIRYSTFAMRWVTGLLFTYITKNYFMTKLCTNATNKKLFFSMRRIIANEIKQTGNFELTQELVDHLCSELGVKEADVYMMNDAMRRPYESIHEIIGSDEDGEITKEQTMFSEDANPEEQIGNMSMADIHQSLVRDALSILDERETMIIQRQILQDDGETDTLEKLGRELGISKERVRQLRERARNKMTTHIQHRMRDKNIRPSDLF